MAETQKLEEELANPPPELLEKLELARRFELLKMMRDLHLFSRDSAKAGHRGGKKKGPTGGDTKQK